MPFLRSSIQFELECFVLSDLFNCEFTFLNLVIADLPMTTFVGTYALNNTFINHHLQTTLHTTFMKSHFV